MSNNKPPITENNIWGMIKAADDAAKQNDLKQIMQPSVDDRMTPLPYYPGDVFNMNHGMTKDQWLQHDRNVDQHGGTEGQILRKMPPESVASGEGDYVNYLIPRAREALRKGSK